MFVVPFYFVHGSILCMVLNLRIGEIGGRQWSIGTLENVLLFCELYPFLLQRSIYLFLLCMTLGDGEFNFDLILEALCTWKVIS